MNILAVDTNSADLVALVHYIRDQYPQSCVTACVDPLFAVEFGRRNPVDLLFAAMQMPDLSGPALDEQLRKYLKRLETTFVGDAPELEAPVARAHGARYMAKIALRAQSE